MKPGTTSKPFPTIPEDVAAAITQAQQRVSEAECPYDPNDPAAVQAYWKEATVRRPGQRGPRKKSKKVLLSVQYSQEVVEYFKSSGEGWQTRIDEALKEWVAAHQAG